MFKKGAGMISALLKTSGYIKGKSLNFFPKELGLRLIQIAPVILPGNIFGEEQKSF
ncbi:UNVERIFIED_ORG: hypothetical protein ABRZ91_002710 [Heyndrickxia coagulans]